MPKLSPYALQLKEKQRLRRMYGLLEKQFHLTFVRASRRKGVTGDNLLQLLETRLDNVVFRLNFAASRPMARQLVLHGHILVNGRPINIPSAVLKPGDTVTVKEKSRQIRCVNEALGRSETNAAAPWLSLNPDQYEGKVERLPARAEIQIPVNEQTIVELYSK
jgi:small subunit ribosomal protein S4